MRILFFLGSPIPFPGAAWTRVSYFANHFKRLGHHVDVAGVFSPRSLGKAGLAYWNGIRIFNASPTIGVGGIASLILNVLSSILTQVFLILFLKPDVVVISVPTGEAAIGAYAGSRLAKARVVIDYRDEWEDYAIGATKSKTSRSAYSLLKTLMTRIYMGSDMIVTVTEPFMDSLRSRGLRDVKLIPNGADLSIFKPRDSANSRKKLRLGETDFVIVYSGGIGSYYRIDIVVRALARLEKNLSFRTKLMVIGAGPDLFRVAVTAKELGISRRIVCLGACNDRNELAKVISSADVGVVPYDDNPLWRNSIPAKFYEYCACGIPVIATAREDSLLSKWIKKNRLGLVVPPLDCKRLSKAIERLSKDTALRDIAGGRARLFMERYYSRKKIADSLYEEIGKLLRCER